jgi:hypothetical protein
LAATVVLALAAPHTGRARAASMAFTPTQDNTLFQDDDRYSSGAGDYVFAGTIASGSPRRALLQFDLAGLPAGASITGASLRLTVSRAGPGSAVGDPASLHRLLSNWGEGSADAGTGGAGTLASPADATWAYRFYGEPGAGIARVPWTVPGGDFMPVASATIAIGGLGVYGFATTPGLTADVQLWLDNPGQNFGWILIGNEAGLQNAKRIWSRTAFTLADRPTLTVTYDPPSAIDADVPIPPWGLAALAGALGLAGALLARRRQA